MTPEPTSLARRQIWATPTPTSSSLPHSCSPYRLPSGGTVVFGGTSMITLGFDAVFEPNCPSVTLPSSIDPLASGVDLSVLDKQEPFYTSTSPLLYAISGVTIISYMLVILLFATPRTFYVGGAGGGISVLGRRGTMGGSYGSNTVIGIGSRPWLQKIAAVTLAISMTIVTADAFKYAEIQYDEGYENAKELTRNIVDGLEIKIVRLISESFVWLAQAQTLIRLFQRHREKVVIQWTAFVLISLEVIFTILNNFAYGSSTHQSRAFANSIPALNYLFALSLNICYAAFVILYALRKRRFAFFHPQMHSMPLMALLSLTAVLIPVVFFILDLSKPDVSGWGNYVRWVGACAASVVVWEWVERIEALEREEKKDGILGREVFDGDEMFDHDNSDPSQATSSDYRKPAWYYGVALGHAFERQRAWLISWGKRRKPRTASQPTPLKSISNESRPSSGHERGAIQSYQQDQNAVTIPNESAPTTVSPVSRPESSSAASTVYAIHYHPPTGPTPPAVGESHSHGREDQQGGDGSSSLNPGNNAPSRPLPHPSRFSRIPLPFRKQRSSPPAEVAAALAEQQIQQSPGPTPPPPTLLDRLHLRRHNHPQHLPKGVIFVPARPRRRPSLSESGHERALEAQGHGSDEESEGGDERPPAVVRNALRRSTPATPITEHEQFISISEAQNQLPLALEPDVRHNVHDQGTLDELRAYQTVDETNGDADRPPVNPDR